MALCMRYKSKYSRPAVLRDVRRARSVWSYPLLDLSLEVKKRSDRGVLLCSVHQPKLRCRSLLGRVLRAFDSPGQGKVAVRQGGLCV